MDLHYFDAEVRILLSNLMRIRIRPLTVLQTWILQYDPLTLPPFHFDTDADPDPDVHFDADPDSDPASKNGADPDPQHWLPGDVRLQIFS